MPSTSATMKASASEPRRPRAHPRGSRPRSGALRTQGGNRITSRRFGASAKMRTRRSTPTPSPPVAACRARARSGSPRPSVRLGVAGRRELALLFEAGALLVGVVELAEGVRHFHAGQEQLESSTSRGSRLSAWPAARARRVMRHEGVGCTSCRLDPALNSSSTPVPRSLPHPARCPAQRARRADWRGRGRRECRRRWPSRTASRMGMRGHAPPSSITPSPCGTRERAQRLLRPRTAKSAAPAPSCRGNPRRPGSTRAW